LSWLRINFVVFFLTTSWIDTLFPRMIFNLRFFSKLYLSIFFCIELVKNYNSSFPHKILWIATVFSYMVFFVMIFFKIIFVDFIFFNIELVENLAL
jgi:hypothetical protein